MNDLNKNAFESYLLRLDKEDAARHILDCITNHKGEGAFELLESIYGDKWNCDPAYLSSIALAAVYILHARKNR